MFVCVCVYVYVCVCVCVMYTDLDKGQCDSSSGCCGLLPHSQPHLIHREGGECVQLNVPARPDHSEERPWHQEAWRAPQ